MNGHTQLACVQFLLSRDAVPKQAFPYQLSDAELEDLTDVYCSADVGAHNCRTSSSQQLR